MPSVAAGAGTAPETGEAARFTPRTETKPEPPGLPFVPHCARGAVVSAWFAC